MIQTELRRLSPTSRETSSTLYTTTTPSQYILPPQIRNQFNTFRHYQTSLNPLPKRPQGRQRSHRRISASYRCMWSTPASQGVVMVCSSWLSQLMVFDCISHPRRVMGTIHMALIRPRAPRVDRDPNTTTSASGGQRPLTLIHVRLPPVNLIHPDEQKNTYRPTVAPTYGGAQVPPQPTSRPYIISAIENSCYSEGLVVAAQEGDVADRDFLLCMSPDLTRIGSLGQLHNHPHQQHQSPAQAPFGAVAPYGSGGVNQRPPLAEYATLLAIPGRTWSIASVPHTSPLASTTGNSPTPVVTNELAMQFVEDPKSFMILTNAGLTFVVKRRALDYLRAAIEDLQKNGTVQPIIECRDRCEYIFRSSLLL